MAEYTHLNRELGRWVGDELSARGLTQRWLADRVPGMTPDLISRSIKGGRPLKAGPRR